eukprot:1094083-Prymnesium_polylepis.1
MRAAASCLHHGRLAAAADRVGAAVAAHAAVGGRRERPRRAARARARGRVRGARRAHSAGPAHRADCRQRVHGQLPRRPLSSHHLLRLRRVVQVGRPAALDEHADRAARRAGHERRRLAARLHAHGGRLRPGDRRVDQREAHVARARAAERLARPPRGQVWRGQLGGGRRPVTRVARHAPAGGAHSHHGRQLQHRREDEAAYQGCLLYTSDAADDM